jgi:hypothetical protein
MKSPSKFYAEARQRAQRRRSPWNLVLLAIKWPLVGLWCAALVKAVLWIPHHGTLTFREAAQHDGPMILIVIPLLFLSFILAMLSANVLLFLIPHARRTFEAEAGANMKLHFRASQKALVKVAAVMAIIAVPVALAASWKLEPPQEQCDEIKDGELYRSTIRVDGDGNWINDGRTKVNP